MQHSELSARCGILTALLFVVFAAHAGAQNDKDRMLRADQELEPLRKEARALPAPPPPSRRGLPIPTLEPLKLARKLADYVKLYDDLPQGIEARSLLATTNHYVGDPAFAVAALEGALAQKLEGTALAEIAAQSAVIRGTWGDLKGAVADFEKAFAASPQHPKAGEWRVLESQWRAAMPQQDADLDAVRAQLGGRLSDQAVFVARRFVQGYPLHKESIALSQKLAERFEKSDAAQHWEFIERIALYGRIDRAWPEAAERSAREAAREGEYERAYLYTLRLIENSERLPGANVAAMVKQLETIEKYWTQALGRAVDVNPKTKRLRHGDLIRRSNLNLFADALRADLEDFEVDYPTCSEIPEIRLLLGRSLAVSDPSTALTKLKSAAVSSPGSQIALDAALAAAPILEKDGDTEAAAKFLSGVREKFKDPLQRAKIGAKEIGILARGGEKDDADKLRAAILAETPDAQKKDVEEILTEGSASDDDWLPGE